MPLDVEDAEVGGRVRAARSAAGMSLRTLAKALGVSVGTMSQLETGRTTLSVVRLNRIASLLGRTVDDILSGRTADPVPPPYTSAASTDRAWRRYAPLDLDPVLRAAMTVFQQTGYHGATVRDVARESGLSVSGIYHYHASKQEMLQRILDLGMEDLLWRCRAAVDAGADEVERFALLVETMALFHTHRREVGFLAASEMRSLDESARADMTVRRALQQRLVDTQVAAGVESGRFETPFPREVSRAVVTMCKSIAEWFNPAGDLRPDEVAARYVHFGLEMVRYTDR
ncbi:TetR family transcriptional regulator [Pseudonocardia halophobica]|uniref:TetR family transcriptional regulator n=1 Tax=Pseudonocardia halophobica TaxID=29401 RepID=UPI003D91EDD6